MSDDFAIFDQLGLRESEKSEKNEKKEHEVVKEPQAEHEENEENEENEKSIGDGNRAWAPKKKNKSIKDDVKGLGYPDPIINIADSIFKTVTEDSIYRVDKRKAIIAKCIHEAYLLIGKPVSLQSIVDNMGVSNITAGAKIVETRIKKHDVDRERITYTSPEDSIKDIMSKWDTDEQNLQDIINLYRQIDDKSSLLNRSRARSVAAAVIYYYALATKRNNIKLSDFSARVELSESTINKLVKEISAILGTPHIIKYNKKNEVL